MTLEVFIALSIPAREYPEESPLFTGLATGKIVEKDRKKPESEAEPQDGPTFDEVVRKMLNTPPKPKKKAAVPKSLSADKRDKRRVDR